MLFNGLKVTKAVINIIYLEHDGYKTKKPMN